MEIIKRIFIVLMTTLLSSINIIAANDTKTNTKMVADTFCITNHDIISLLTEDYISKKGNLKQKYYAELKSGIIDKDIPKKAYISRR